MSQKVISSFQAIIYFIFSLILFSLLVWVHVQKCIDITISNYPLSNFQKITSVIDTLTDSNDDQTETGSFKAEIEDSQHEQMDEEHIEDEVSLPSVAELSQLSKVSRVIRDKIRLYWISKDRKGDQSILLMLKIFLERATVDDYMMRLKLLTTEIASFDLQTDQIIVFQSIILSFQKIFEESIFLNIRKDLQKLISYLSGKIFIYLIKTTSHTCFFLSPINACVIFS